MAFNQTSVWVNGKDEKIALLRKIHEIAISKNRKEQEDQMLQREYKTEGLS